MRDHGSSSPANADTATGAKASTGGASSWRAKTVPAYRWPVSAATQCAAWLRELLQ